MNTKILIDVAHGVDHEVNLSRGIFHISKTIDGHFGHSTWPASKVIGL